MFDLRPAPGLRLALQLSPRDGGLDVRVVESVVGEDTAAPAALPPLDDVLRLASQPTFYEDVGRGLFRALLPGPLAELYRAAAAQAAMSGQVLTLELRFDRALAQLARYPWELLHDGTRFLLQAGAVNLVRYLAFPEPPRPLTPRQPVELLVITARPKDQPPLSAEFEALQAAFAPLVAADRLDLALLTPPTWEALMDWLLAGAPDVLHFAGHGAWERTGRLVFEDIDGESDPVDASTLAAAFYGTDLRLAVLSACDSSKTGGESLLGSVAPALILAGIPAVVAMQQRIPDDAAQRFARGFYAALLKGQDLPSAVMAGRKQLIRTAFWHVPTLYLRAAKVPQITQAILERRIDTAGPRQAPVNLPLRFGLWVRRPDAPTPSDDELRRLLGLEPAAPLSRDATRAPLRFPVKTGRIEPGLVEVRIIAPDCELHTPAVRQLSVFPDFDTPPLWFALTPHRAGRLDVIFELSQGGAAVASVAHTIEITAQAGIAPVAVVHSHRLGSASPLYMPRPVREREEAAPPPVVTGTAQAVESLEPAPSGAQFDMVPAEMDAGPELPDWLSASLDEGTTEREGQPRPPSPPVQAPAVRPAETDVASEETDKQTDKQLVEVSPLHEYTTVNAKFGATFTLHVVPGDAGVAITALEPSGAIRVQMTDVGDPARVDAQLAAFLAGVLAVPPGQIEIVREVDPAARKVNVSGITFVNAVKILSAQLTQSRPKKSVVPPEPPPTLTSESRPAPTAVASALPAGREPAPGKTRPRRADRSKRRARVLLIGLVVVVLLVVLALVLGTG